MELSNHPKLEPFLVLKENKNQNKPWMKETRKKREQNTLGSNSRQQQYKQTKGSLNPMHMTTATIHETKVHDQKQLRAKHSKQDGVELEYQVDHETLLITTSVVQYKERAHNFRLFSRVCTHITKDV